MCVVIHELWYYINKKSLGRETETINDEAMEDLREIEEAETRSARNLAEHANEPIGTQVHFSFGEAINFHDVQAQLDAAAESGSIREGLHITLSNCLKHLCNGSEFCQAVLDEQTRLFNSHVNSLLAKHKDEVDAMNAKIADLESGRLAEKRPA